MRSQENVYSLEQATRSTIDSFNKVFNRHDAEGLAAFLTSIQCLRIRRPLRMADA